MNHAMRVFEMSNAGGRWIDDEEKQGMDYSNRKCQSSLLGSAGFGSPKIEKIYFSLVVKTQAVTCSNQTRQKSRSAISRCIGSNYWRRPAGCGVRCARTSPTMVRQERYNGGGMYTFKRTTGVPKSLSRNE